jgi:hypothetical protein
MWTVNLLFLIAIIVTMLLMRHEVRRYTDARLAGQVPDFERRRFTRRMLGVVILTVVLALTYFGYTNIGSFAGHPLLFAIYLVTIFILLFVLIVLALFDMRAVFQNSMKRYVDESDETARLEEFLAKDREKIERKTS